MISVPGLANLPAETIEALPCRNQQVWGLRGRAGSGFRGLGISF